MRIEVGKKYLTRGGVVVACVRADLCSPYPFHMETSTGTWYSVTWEGFRYGSDERVISDIVAAVAEDCCEALRKQVAELEARVAALTPKPEEFWVNVYSTGALGARHPTREIAKTQKGVGTFKTFHCIEVK